ncbi:MAG: amidase [Gammaproteobacteria bacterium]|nr:amidase [Gammaproteobacteria bacterium]
MTNEEICFKPALELARLVRKKALSPVEITDAFLDRIEALDPRLNAYLTVAGDYAREAARRAEQALATGNPLGPLHGVPFSIKDLVFTASIRTTGGSRVYEHFVPDYDSIVVKRLKEAGGILLGKTSTPEFGHKGTTENLIIGDTHNPWALDKTPGGSSGGAGAATAAGLSPLSIGTDGGGFIRIPVLTTRTRSSIR